MNLPAPPADRTDGLSVAAAFEVKHAVIVPNRAHHRRSADDADRSTGVVFPVPEGRRTAPRPLLRHGWPSSASTRCLSAAQQVVHDREQPLLHFRRRTRVPPMRLRYRSLRLKATKFSEFIPCACQLALVQPAPLSTTKSGVKPVSFVAWHDEHVFDKVGLPRHLDDEAYAKTGVRAGAAPGVDDVQVFAAQLARDQAFFRLRHRLAITVCCHCDRGRSLPTRRCVASLFVADDVFIARRTAGEDPGINSHSARVGHHAAGRAGQLREVSCAISKS